MVHLLFHLAQIFGHYFGCRNTKIRNQLKDDTGNYPANMRSRLLSIITTWPFLLSLAVLVLNDWCFKGVYPGIITGKLSDFTGIAVVSLLLIAACPRRNFSVFCGVAFTFLWWKSPASEVFIRYFNELGLYRIGRTVDYTDMMAMLVFPLCHAVVTREDTLSLSWPRVRHVMAIPTAAMTLFAILGTSSRPYMQNYVVRTISATEKLRFTEVEDVIKEVAFRHGLDSCRQLPNQDAVTLSSGEIELTYSFPKENLASFKVVAYTSGIIQFPWDTTGDEKAEALRTDLKRNLTAKFRGLEYIEPLEHW